jgi:hypothetical protein
MLRGFQMELWHDPGTEVETLSLTVILDQTASLQAWQAGESIDQTLARLAATLQQQGAVRQ